jgi:hypothetical protein
VRSCLAVNQPQLVHRGSERNLPQLGERTDQLYQAHVPILHLVHELDQLGVLVRR